MPPPALLQAINIPTEPYLSAGIDLHGPFPMSTAANKWVAVANGHATRWASVRESCPLPNVANFIFHNMIPHHGAARKQSRMLLLVEGHRRFCPVTTSNQSQPIIEEIVDDRSLLLLIPIQMTLHNALTERLLTC